MAKKRRKKLSKLGKLVFTLFGLFLVIIGLSIALLVRSCGTQNHNPGPIENNQPTEVEYSFEADTIGMVEAVEDTISIEQLEENSKQIKTAKKPPKNKTFAYLDSIIIQKQGEVVYGIQSSLFEMQEGEIQSGQTFSMLLNNLFNVNIVVVNRLIGECKGVFDLRKMRVGNKYTAFFDTDKEGKKNLQYLVYEITKKEYVIFGTGNEVFVKVDQKEVKSTEKYAEAVINSSLYGAIYEQGLSPMLAVKLSEIYKWTIDFFAIQKGDKFRVIYEEEFIDGQSIGIGKIYGAEFTHLGIKYLAVNFLQQGEDGYWNSKGANLRKNFLSAPLSFSARVSSSYGMRTHPIRRVRSMHNGVDYAAPQGTPVLAIADGRITRLGWDPSGGGKRIWIRHEHGLESAYLHLHNYARGLGTGSRVKQGQVIGYVGSTGMSTGNHLDFRIKKNGKYINPQKIPSTPTTPILNANKPAFGRMRDDVLRIMDEYKSLEN